MSTNNTHLKPSGREALRFTENGAVLRYTYPDQDESIPQGMRRVTFLENYEGENN